MCALFGLFKEFHLSECRNYQGEQSLVRDECKLYQRPDLRGPFIPQTIHKSLLVKYGLLTILMEFEFYNFAQSFPYTGMNQKIWMLY